MARAAHAGAPVATSPSAALAAHAITASVLGVYPAAHFTLQELPAVSWPPDVQLPLAATTTGELNVYALHFAVQPTRTGTACHSYDEQSRAKSWLVICET